MHRRQAGWRLGTTSLFRPVVIDGVPKSHQLAGAVSSSIDDTAVGSATSGKVVSLFTTTALQ